LELLFFLFNFLLQFFNGQDLMGADRMGRELFLTLLQLLFQLIDVFEQLIPSTPQYIPVFFVYHGFSPFSVEKIFGQLWVEPFIPLLEQAIEIFTSTRISSSVQHWGLSKISFSFLTVYAAV
jgi:hypothetical protein